MSVTEPAAGPPLDIELGYIKPDHKRAWRKTDIARGPGVAVTASRQVLGDGTARQFGGYSIRETTGTAGASLRLHDGTGVNGQVVANFNLAANESVRDVFSPYGVHIDTGGIYLEVLSGSVEGVIYWR